LRIYVYPALIAALVAFVITPVVRALAKRLSIVDIPDPRRPGPLHTLPTPLLGGLAIYAAVAFSALVGPEHHPQLAAMLAPGALVLAVGLIHHLRPMRPWLWLVVQCLVAGAAVALGVKAELLAVGWIDALLTVGWLLIVMNVVMLVNDLSGATAGVTAVGSAALFILGIWSGDRFVLLMSCLLGSACVGSLGYSLMPASISLSRGGSALLGLWLGSLLAVGPWRGPDSLQMAIAPLLVLALPLFNAILLARARSTQSDRIRTAPSSLTERLLATGMTVEQTLCVEYGIGLLGAIGAALGPVLHAPLWTVGLCLLVAALWIFGTRLIRGEVHG